VSTAAIRLDGLTKYYGAVVGVEDLSFEVARGEVFGFLGANGAGKTTTIRLLVDLLKPTRGRAFVAGFDCQARSLDARRSIGYLPGELPIYADLSAAGYLDFLSQLSGQPVNRTRLAELLLRFNVSDVDLRRRLRDQSHGMKQKIGIIQALIGDAPVLILDEPTAGLDPLMVNAFNETIGEIRRRGDTTVFLSSHILAEVATLCDRIGLIRGGRMVSVSTMRELRHAAPRRVSIDLAAPVAAVPPVPGARVLSHSPTRIVLDVEGPLGPLLAAMAALPVRDLHVEPFNLEDHVLRHYAGETS
jgi:ABC-2 type transport system ATP-binding protein